MASRLRRARPEDAQALAEIVQAGFETYRSFARADWQPPDELGRVHESAADLEDDTNHFCMLAEVGGTAVGMVRWLPAKTPSPDGYLPDVHFRNLFVLEPYWGTGIAVELHTAAIEEMRSRGIGTARLFTPAQQLRARRFYEREGWALRVDAYYDPKIDFEIVEYALRP
jgi:diamine N-acetyltransferase